MTTKYPHLLSPMQVGNTVFKNHIISAPMGLHALQSGEPYPTEDVIACFANKAKGGAACVTMTGTQSTPVTNPANDGYHHAWDIYTEHNRKMLERLSAAIHFYGAKASMEINGTFAAAREYAVSAGTRVFPNGMEMSFKEMDQSMIEESIENHALHAKKLKECGYDMVLLHMAYRSTLAGQFINPITNKRTDKYGGSAENRARYIVEVCEAIKRACGRNFLIELRLSAFDTDPEGVTIDDTLVLTKLLEGKVDLLHAHAGTGPDMTQMGNAHIMSFRPDYALLPGAEQLKAGGCPIKVGAIGGFQDPEVMEQVLAEGKADYIVTARGLIADPNAVNKMYAGASEDIVPCIKCLRCHDSACFENSFVCSVNPTIGLEHKLDRMIPEKTAPKNVAVVGGGPAGMEAAIVAADRGHKVTLFEKENHLGGQLVFSDYAWFKRNLSKFKKYLIAQVEKKNVEIKLSTPATPEMLADYDVVLAAVGAEPLILPVPGANGENVVTAPQVFGHESELADDIIIIGGGQVGCETGYHLAEMGKNVTMIEMQSALAPDASPSYRKELIFYMDKKPNLKYILGARCASIQPDGLTYIDTDGAEHELKAGTVVMAAGMRPRQAVAVSLAEGNFNTRLIGDCGGLGNVTGAMRTAFSAASIL